jgi:hypothetical protein
MVNENPEKIRDLDDGSFFKRFSLNGAMDEVPRLSAGDFLFMYDKGDIKVE